MKWQRKSARKMKLLVLYGVNCTKEIWNQLDLYLKEYEIDYVAYPHDVTLKATKVKDISKWVYTHYSSDYDVVIGHSLGGLIALELAAVYKMAFKKIIYLDTNLKPAESFYRNLMTPEHMAAYGDKILEMFQDERKYYTPELFKEIQEDFDYTHYLELLDQKVYAVYGDRNQIEYERKIEDLNLPMSALEKLEIRFVHNACHMIMLENPEGLYAVLKSILEEPSV